MNKYKFGKKSQVKILELHTDLQRVCNLAIERTAIDFGIGTAWRGREEQNAAFEKGLSKVQFPDGKHNKVPAQAFDFLAYVKGKYTDKPQYYYHIAGVVLACAAQLGVGVRWGGDWDGDGDFSDNTFNDLGHIELTDEYLAQISGKKAPTKTK